MLPKLYVDLKGKGIEVVLRARNSFLKAIRTVNTFDGLPDVPQAYFELKIRGGAERHPQQLLQRLRRRASRTASTTTRSPARTARRSRRALHAAGGLRRHASLVSASISSKTIKVNKKGIGKVRVSCSASPARAS